MDKKKSIREQAIEDVLTHLLPLGDDILTPNEQMLLIEVLVDGKKFTDIAKTTDLTPPTQKIIFERAVQRISKIISGASEKLLNYSMMENILAENTRKLDSLQEIVYQRSKLSSTAKELLSVTIDKIDISARAKNICSSAGIYKVADLVQWTRIDFLKNRTAGMKTADEVEQFLVANDLSWGMNV